MPVHPATDWSKTVLFSVLGVAVILGAVFVGTVIGKDQNNNQRATPEKSAAMTEATPKPLKANATPTASLLPASPSVSPTTSPAVSRKTYTETREVKFSLSYPSSWTVNTKDGMLGEKSARFDSGSERVGSVAVGWNSQPVEPNCSSTGQKKELVQIKNRVVEMCHSPGSSQEPEGYFYNSTANGVSYSITTSNYPGEANRKIILEVLSTLDI